MKPLRKIRIYFAACCVALFFIAAAASFSGYYQKWHFAEADVPGEDDAASFEAMVDGTASRPYVYRHLIPAVANLLDRAAPEHLKQQLYADQQSTASDPLLYALTVSPTGREQRYFFRYLMIYVQTFTFALLAIWAMYATCTGFGFSPPSAVFAPIIFILGLPYLQTVGGFFYDYSELAFCAAAVWIAIRQRWWWLAPVAIIGTWNKESFLFFILSLYPFLRRRSTPSQASAQTGLLCGISAAVYGLDHLFFTHNQGGVVEFWLVEHLRLLVHPRSILLATEETYGIRMVRGFTLGPVLLLIAIVVRGWRYLPAEARAHAKIAALVNVPLYLCFGFPGELRGLSLLYITLLLLIATQIDDWVRSSASAKLHLTEMAR